MRYILVVIGLIGTLFGIYVVSYGPSAAKVTGSPILQASVVTLAIGLATIDIVLAIQNRRE